MPPHLGRQHLSMVCGSSCRVPGNACLKDAGRSRSKCAKY
jgi:hypothetical protein